MKLVLLTSHYPYGQGEDFLENQVRIAEQRFEEIVFVTLEKAGSPLTKYVPSNARIVCARQYSSELLRRLHMLSYLFFSRVWKETLRIRRERGNGFLLSALKSVLLAEDVNFYLRRSRPLWAEGTEPVVYLSYWLSYTATYLAKNKALFHGCCVAQAHGGDCFYDRGIIPYRAEQLSELDAIFPISEAGKQDIFTHYGNQVPKLREKLIVSRLGINRLSEAMNPWEEKTVRTVVSCSSIIPLKRLDLLVNALSYTALPIHWIHFGNGPQMEQIVEEAKKTLAPRQNISFEFRGNVPNEEILRFYETASVDLFVNCSDSEGIPVSVMEAMGYGIPAIGRNVGGVGELVDNTCGRLLPAEITAWELSQAIEELLALPRQQIEGLRKSAAERISAQYDANTNYERFFDQVITVLHKGI